jgi:hypothetical protein
MAVRFDFELAEEVEQKLADEPHLVDPIDEVWHLRAADVDN